MALNKTIYIVGDQSDPITIGLKTLLRHNTSNEPILISFLSSSYKIIANELSLTSEELQSRLPKYSNLEDLLETKGHIALSHAFTTIYQFGLFMLHCSKTDTYPTTPSSYLMGICTGTLPLAAISVSSNLNALLPLALQTVRLSFKAGLLATEVLGRLSPSPTTGEESWATIYPGMTKNRAEEAIASYVEKNKIPLPSRPYLTSTSNRGCTVSGPLSSLGGLHESPEFSQLKGVKIPIWAPYHAPHLYTSEDISELLSTVSEPSSSATSTLPILSCATGEIGHLTTFKNLLGNALEEIFLKQLQWDSLTATLTSILQGSPEMKTTMVPISTGSSLGLKALLKHQGISNIEIASSPMETMPSLTPALQDSKSKIAIVGMSGRFPTAESIDAFWALLRSGLDVHSVVPPIRWDANTHVDPTGKAKNTSATPFGCWLEEPGLFDAKFFGMSPREAKQVDPAQRLALLTAYEAMEQAGIVPGATPSTRKDRVGVFYGVTSNDWMETNSAQNIDTYFIPGGNRAFIPGRINYIFKFSGPSYSVDTACSSSLSAIHAACNFLWQGDVDTVIAGGTNVLTNPDFTAGLDRGHFLSRTGNCRTFDDGADGYCRGEGVATVILKRLEDAIADNDPIQGIILNAATNHSAESDSITRPNIGAQTHIFNKVLNGTDPADVSYIEMHGTGTQTGDNTEMTSVIQSFAPDHGRRQRLENRPLYLGSAKANIGHGEAASGASSLIKVLLMMQNSTIPPHCGIKTRINRRFPTNLKERRIHIADKATKWNKTSTTPLRALVNNFSAAGGNTALLIEEAPFREPLKGTDPRSIHLVAISAKAAGSLKANAETLVKFLRGSHETPVSLPVLSYTTTARRLHHAHRIAVAGSSIEEIATKLSAAVDREVGKTRAIAKPSIVFTFTGQGSGYMAMGKELFETVASFRADIKRYNQLAQSQGFASILPVICGIDGEADIESQLPEVVQLATACLQMALVKLWAAWGVVADSVVGHSLGHYAALNAAGVLSESDTIFLVGTRAQLLQKSCKPNTHSMLAVKSTLSALEVFLKGSEVEVACINGPGDVVLSGTREDIKTISELLKTHSIRMRQLQVPYAFHSSQVDSILDEFVSIAQGVTYHKPSLPVLCPLTSSVVSEEGVFGPQHLADHCRQRVNMVGALKTASEIGTFADNTIFLEIGPHPVVCGMVKATITEKCTAVSSLARNQKIWKTTTDALSALYLAGATIRWREFHRNFPSCHEVLRLPAYSWDLKDYWIQYVNDWSLRKGEAAQYVDPTEAERLRILSTTIHRVVEESSVQDVSSITIESDISRPDLYPLVQGHKVNGVPLCTPSVYADIAFSIARYLKNKYRSQIEEAQVDIGHMEILKALVAQPKGPQLIRAVSEINWATLSGTCHFMSVDAQGKVTINHSNCSITFTKIPDPEWLKARGAEYKVEIEKLKGGLETESCYKFNKSMVYRMVESLADFDPHYRALTEVYLNNKDMAAASKIDFASVSDTDKTVFHTHPAFIDAFSQSAGFVMNANERSDPSVEVFVNHGWSSLQLYEKVEPTTIYQSYVKMAQGKGTIWEGSIFILDGDRLVAKFGDVQLQGVPKRLLHSILSSASKAQSGTLPTKFAPASKIAVKVDSGHPSLQVAITQQPKIALNTSAPVMTVTSTVPGVEISKIMEVVSEESGVDIAELNDKTEFAAIGVDSLLSLIISSRLKDETGFETDSGFSIFDEFKTVGELKEGLAKFLGLSNSSDSSTPSTPRSEEAVLLDVSASTTPPLQEAEMSEVAQKPVCAASSVILQRGTGGSDQILFLFPDGSGSAFSYVDIPRVNESLTIIGLICPYMKDPETLASTQLSDLMGSYLAEVRRRKSKGPYNLGGWSSGGVYAYNAAASLIAAGEEVQHLVLIDSPAPNGMDKLPQRFYDHCSSAGIFGQIESDRTKKTQPKWLIPHFNATIDVLSSYYADPLPTGITAPKVSIIWAKECVFDGVRFPKMAPGPDDNEGMKFLTEKRTDFTAGDWAPLFSDEIHVAIVDADHFSMMHGEPAKELSKFIDEATMV